MFVPPSPLAEPAVLELLARAGTDPADGLQVVALDRLAARPFDPGVALLLLPAAPGRRARPLPAREPPPLEAAPARRSPGAPDAALPGRHGHGADPVALLQRLYPPDHPVLSATGDRTVGTAGRGRAGRRGPRLLPPLAGRPQRRRRLLAALARPPAAPAGRLPLGPRAGPPDASAVPARGDLRGLRRPGGRLDPGAGGGARRPAPADRAARPVRRGGRRLRPGRRAGGRDQQDHPPPPARLRRRAGGHGR